MTAADQRPREAGAAAGSRPRSDTSQRWMQVIAAVAERHAAGEALTVSAIATAAGVPRSWLYQYPDLVDHIHLTRRSEVPPAAPSPPWAGAAPTAGTADTGVNDVPGATVYSAQESTGPITPGSPCSVPPPRRAEGQPDLGADRPDESPWTSLPPTRAWRSPTGPATAGPATTTARPARAEAHPVGPGRGLSAATVDPLPAVSASALTVVRPQDELATALPPPGGGFEPDLSSIATWLQGSGVVIPVLGASGGAGASVAAAALFDVCDAAGRTTALVDVADPSRSGLALAGRPTGSTRRVGDGVTLTQAERGQRGHLHRLAPTGRAVQAGMVPPAHQWFPEGTGAEITIVDVGWDPWATLAQPAAGPGSWWASSADLPEEMRPCPVLVCSPTQPSVARAQQLMTRLEPWSRTRRIAEVLALIVCGTSRWPPGAAGVAGREVAEMPTFFLPRHRALSSHGITPAPLPSRVQAGATRLALDWGLI